jgi:hypothetical protein
MYLLRIVSIEYKVLPLGLGDGRNDSSHPLVLGHSPGISYNSSLIDIILVTQRLPSTSMDLAHRTGLCLLKFVSLSNLCHKNWGILSQLPRFPGIGGIAKTREAKFIVNAYLWSFQPAPAAKNIEQFILRIR